jgi:hypothetical protein
MVRSQADLDDELRAWLQEAHDVVGLQRRSDGLTNGRPRPTAAGAHGPALDRREPEAAGSVRDMGHPAVRAMLTDYQAPTCSLTEFLEAWNEEPDLVWQVRTGHLIHLLEAAVSRIEVLEAQLSD